MNKEQGEAAKGYTRPMVLSHQPIRFETSHCWNKGHGPNAPSNGNGGYNNGNGKKYPNDPYSPKKDHP